MDILQEVKEVLGEVLSLGARTDSLSRESPLLGSIPEFDSMAVVAVLTGIEERFGFFIEDDEITAEVFESIGSLTDFVETKLSDAQAPDA